MSKSSRYMAGCYVAKKYVAKVVPTDETESKLVDSGLRFWIDTDAPTSDPLFRVELYAHNQEHAAAIALRFGMLTCLPEQID